MARKTLRARRFFSLIFPFFFITSVYAEQTPESAKTVTVEAKNEMFAPQHPDQYQSWKATSEQSAREDALAEDPRLVILWAGYPFSRDYNKPRGHAYAVTDVRETLRTGAPKTATSMANGRAAARKLSTIWAVPTVITPRRTISPRGSQR